LRQNHLANGKACFRLLSGPSSLMQNSGKQRQ
jgi:hypothetical protein